MESGFILTALLLIVSCLKQMR